MKNFKKVIVPAIAAIALCLSLIAGATYAWFTDTAKTNVNKIQSGTLDVALEMSMDGETWEDAEGKTLNFLKKEAGELVASENVLWEPGCTYNLPMLRISNKGNLSLKYRVILSGATGDTKLLEAISFTAKVTKNDEEEATTVSGAYGSALLANTLVANEGEEAVYDIIELSAHMDENAGNEYQNLTIENIAITVYATQAPVEYDSFDNKYDENTSALEEITEGTATLTEGVIVGEANKVAVKASGEGTVVNIAGGIYDGGEGGNNKCIEVSNGATVNIYGGTFTVGGDADGYGNSVVETWNGIVNIYGGFFSTKYSYGGKYYVLNQKNSQPGEIHVYGGTFVNQDPSLGDDNLGGNFVAAGYTVVKKTVGSDIWYTVVAQPETEDALKDVLWKGGNIEINKDVNIGAVDTNLSRAIINKPTTLKLTSKIVSADDMGYNTTNYAALFVDADTTINATAEGGIDTGNNGGYGITVRNGATLTITGGYYYGGGTAVQVEVGTLYITGGTFACEPYSDPVYGNKFLINCIDANWRNGTAKIVITGGTFVNFDPSDSASENPHGNFVAEGYKVVSSVVGEDTYYTVVKA